MEKEKLREKEKEMEKEMEKEKKKETEKDVQLVVGSTSSASRFGMWSLASSHSDQFPEGLGWAWEGNYGDRHIYTTLSQIIIIYTQNLQLCRNRINTWRKDDFPEGSKSMSNIYEPFHQSGSSCVSPGVVLEG
jgi:hypothetical protein